MLSSVQFKLLADMGLCDVLEVRARRKRNELEITKYGLGVGGDVT